MVSELLSVPAVSGCVRKNPFPFKSEDSGAWQGPSLNTQCVSSLAQQRGQVSQAGLGHSTGLGAHLQTPLVHPETLKTYNNSVNIPNQCLQRCG